MKQTSSWKGYVYVIVSAVLFGCMPLGAKYVYANGVNPMSLVLYRNCLSLPVMLWMVKSRGESLKLTSRDLGKLLALSVLGSVLTPALLYASYNYVSSGTATTLHFVYPAVVILAETLFCRVPLRLRQLVCVALCMAGIGMFYTPGGNVDILGGALSLLSGVTYGSYIVLLARLDTEHISGVKLSFYLSLICSGIMLLACVLTGQLTLPGNLLCWGICFVFSLTLCVGAVVLFRQGTQIIGGQKAAILSTFEPITGIFVGILMFREPFGWKVALGSILVLAAAVLIAKEKNAAKS